MTNGVYATFAAYRQTGCAPALDTPGMASSPRAFVVRSRDRSHRMAAHAELAPHARADAAEEDKSLRRAMVTPKARNRAKLIERELSRLRAECATAESSGG